MDKYLGKRIDGRYEIRDIIGVGGMSVVYKAYDSIDDRGVAVKILKEELLENQEFRRRFKNESKAIAVMSHPNIVKVFDVGFGDKLQYIVEEYIDGITLKEYIERQGTVPWKDALYFATQILRALQHAHDKGIVHRDIKPQNIMLLQDGTIKVTDFGIARFSRSEHRTMTDKAIGSVHYISPEQARGEVTDEKSDLYSVGVIMYEMLTGKLPFDAESAVSVAIMQLQNEPTKLREINPDIPEGLEEITLRAMQKNPAERYQSAAEMLNDIQQFKQNPSIQFEYKYFVDNEPTKFIPVSDNSENTDESDDENGKKSTIMPVLTGVTVAFAVVAIFIGLLLAGRFLGWGPFSSAGDITRKCPNLVGLVYNDVIKSDEYKDYTIILKSSEYSTEYPAGQIMHQSPESGKTLKGKCEIVVKVSLGGKKQVLDDYKGYKIEMVESNLAALNLKYNIKEIYSDEQAEGFVISTVPAAGENIDSSVEIVVYVSRGSVPSFVDVSNYVGMSESDAKRQIEGDGLKVGSVNYDESTKYPKGYVISQSVGSGTTVNNGTTVNLVVSSGSSVTAYVPIPATATKSFNITVFHNGKQIYDTGTLDPTTLEIDSSGNKTVKVKIAQNMSDFGSSSATIMMKYSGNNYIQYKVDFGSGQCSKDTEFTLPDDILHDSTVVESTTSED